MRMSFLASLERSFASALVVVAGVALFVAGGLPACGGIAVEPGSSSASSSGATGGSESVGPPSVRDAGGVDGGAAACGMSSSSSGGGGDWSGTPPATCDACECWIVPLTCLPDPAPFAGVEDAGLLYGWLDVDGGLPAAECASLCGPGALWCAPETSGTPATAIACHGACEN